jgi:hypothetical protein
VNTRHISLFNEFNYVASNTGGTLGNDIAKNINCISLNNSMRYAIKNLSIDIGSIASKSGVQKIIETKPVFPIRFFLSNNPIVDSFYDGYNLYYIAFNGISSPSSYNYNQLDRVDSSNQSAFINPKSYYNFLETRQSDTQGDFNQTQKKTNTVAEYNFFNLSLIDTSTFNITTSATANEFKSYASNNDISDFYFNSNQEDNLAISIFPRISMNTIGTLVNEQILDLYLSYTINFDLVEEGF